MGNWKKIIFLDIDGVLAGYDYLCNRKRVGLIDPKKCKLLNTLGDIGVEVVISSSWGYDNGRTEKSLRGCGLTLPIIGYTDHFYQDWLCRGNEIEKWLHQNFGGMGTKYYMDEEDILYHRHQTPSQNCDYEYVIFDDDQDMLYGQKDNYIHVNRVYGLTKRNINKARKILNRE